MQNLGCKVTGGTPGGEDGVSEGEGGMFWNGRRLHRQMAPV